MIWLGADPNACHAWMQFVEKDPKLAEPVLQALLKYWPVTNSQKEVIFLGELEEILELTQVCCPSTCRLATQLNVRLAWIKTLEIVPLGGITIRKRGGRGGGGRCC